MQAVLPSNYCVQKSKRQFILRNYLQKQMQAQ